MWRIAWLASIEWRTRSNLERNDILELKAALNELEICWIGGLRRYDVDVVMLLNGINMCFHRFWCRKLTGRTRIMITFTRDTTGG